MTDFEMVKEKLIEEGYEIIRSSEDRAFFLRKGYKRILIWIDRTYPDRYWYLFEKHDLNISFHRKGFTVWEYDAKTRTTHTKDKYFIPEHILETGQHIGNHTTIDKMINIVFGTEEES